MLYRIVHEHFETFRAQASALRDGDGLPRFVEHAFREFLRCRWLAGGFARLRCDGCGVDRLVPFSCKGRALCPSCGGRRMSDRAAHLVDRVFPSVPVRQWVLSLPFPLRYHLAWDHDLCRAVAGMLVRAVFRPMYLVGADHPNKVAARRILERAATSRERFVTDAEVFQEILHRYVTIGRRDAIQPAFDVLRALVDEVFAVDSAVVERAKDLVLGYRTLSARGAIHVAAMQAHDVSRIMSFDAGFDEVPGLDRLDG